METELSKFDPYTECIGVSEFALTLRCAAGLGPELKIQEITRKNAIFYGFRLVDRRTVRLADQREAKSRFAGRSE
jgi:hypothetical protein